MSEQYNYMVCIHCMTYNHKPYILDALNGFAMQQTDFPYVALVIDDASTDGEPDVLRKYIAEQCDATSLVRTETDLYESIQVQSATNPNCLFAFYFLKENQFRTGKKKTIIAEWDAQTKYIAMCEGDDYWTAPYKLQKQVDFLDGHEEYLACFHRNKIYWQDENRWCDDAYVNVFHGEEGMSQNVSSYFNYPFLQVLTCMYRCVVLTDKDWYSHLRTRSRYDQTFFFMLVEKGRFWVMNDVMGVYRRISSGIATGSSPKEAASKLYYTWRDVYEVHPTEQVKGVYLSQLRAYAYRLAKYESPFEYKIIYQLYVECVYNESSLWNKINFLLRLIKGVVLRIQKLK